MRKLMQTSSRKNKVSSNLATICVNLHKNGEIKLDLDYINPYNIKEVFKKKFGDDERTSVLLSSIIYDIIYVYEDLEERIQKVINMS